MKTQWQDIVLCGLFIGGILACSLGIVWLINPWSKALLQDYHVLFDGAAMIMLFGLLSALAVRLLLGAKPMPPDKAVYPLDHPILTYWKLLTILHRMGHGAVSLFVPVFAKPVVDALFGARIGRDAAFGGTIDDPHMVTIGNGVVLGHASLVTGNYLDKGRLVTGTVRIGDGVTIGANAIIMPNTTIGDGATVMSGAVVGPDAVIKPGEVWRGNPARPWITSTPAAPAAASAQQ